jgi:hypothetical protein
LSLYPSTNMPLRLARVHLHTKVQAPRAWALFFALVSYRVSILPFGPIRRLYHSPFRGATGTLETNFARSPFLGRAVYCIQRTRRGQNAVPVNRHSEPFLKFYRARATPITIQRFRNGFEWRVPTSRCSGCGSSCRAGARAVPG